MKTNWSAVGSIALCVLVLFTALQFFVNIMLMALANDMRDKGAEYKRGKLYARTDAFYFIKRHDKPLALQYLREREGK